MLIGGGKLTPSLWDKFTSLAGGKDQAVVVAITTAHATPAGKETIHTIQKATGIANISVLQTDRLSEANAARFTEPLRKATAVFIDGDRPWRLADAYLNTLVHQALTDLLNRGGVIAGTSAGAAIQGSFLWRGDTAGSEVQVGDHTQGLGFLKNAAVDQDLLSLNRQFDLADFIKGRPNLIGIGLESSTAAVVRKDTLEVIGKSYAAIYDHDVINGNGIRAVFGEKDSTLVWNGSFFLLGEGQKYDLATRKAILPKK